MNESKPQGSLTPALAGIARQQPALSRANALLTKASEQGFDWPDAASVLRKIREELGEVEQAHASGNREHLAQELGDLLSAVANLARFEGIDPEQALHAANDKFTFRFGKVEQVLHDEGRNMRQASLKEMIRIWNAQKPTELGAG